MAKKFEYCTVDTDASESLDAALKRFNDLGQSGWQIVFIATARQSVTARLWLMREIDA